MQPDQIRRLVWWALGVALALIAVYAIGYGTRLGWFGVGLIGLAILAISTQVDLDVDHPGSLGLHGSGELNHVARQLEERFRASPEDRFAFIAGRAKRRRILSLIRGVGLVLTLVGFGLFVKQQL
ncbi:MAG: hypothetical protein R3174_09115 [Gammaproteobacteria bacterium]|nr:hypothetical protein [Gammaproteobacteria bacterium]